MPRASSRLLLPLAGAALEAVAGEAEAGDYAAALALGQRLGAIWFHAVRVRRRVVCAALSRHFPSWTRHRVLRTAASVLGGAAANVTTLLWATAEDRDPGEVLAHVRFEGLEHWKAVADRGAVAAVTHTGNWDLAAMAACMGGVPLAAVSRNLSYAPMDRLWTDRRRRAGVEILDGSAGLGEILAAAGPGRALAIVTDQRTGPAEGGIRIPFMGDPAWTSTLPAAVSLRKGLPILPVMSRTEEDGTLLVSVGRPMDPGERAPATHRIREISVALNEALESWIRRWPASWLWLHRRWL